MHSFKRRRISNSSLSDSHASTNVTTASPKIITASNTKSIPNPTCVSCHRSLNATQGYLILCSRCSTPTCVVCSRTCNASDSPSPPPSTAHSISIVPGTPALSSSSSPSSSTPTSAWPSPRRVALALTSSTNTTATTCSAVPLNPHSIGTLGKRRKIVDDESPAPGGRENAPHGLAQRSTVIDLTPANYSSSASAGADGGDHQKTSGIGCGRIICRRCCSENVQRNTITCYDCFPPPAA